MKPEAVAVLCSPETHKPLELASETGADGKVREVLLDPQSGRKFPIRDGIPIFLEDSQVTGLNRKYQKLYDRIAPFYDLPNRVYAYFKGGGEKQVRTTYLRKLEIGEGDKVLEVSIGTGANLRYLPPTAHYFGLDISWAC